MPQLPHPSYRLTTTHSLTLLSPSPQATTPASFKMASGPTYPNLFRSEEMSLIQLYIPSEVAHDTVYEIAEMGNVQFKDVRV